MIPYPDVPGVTFQDVAEFPGYCVGDDGSVFSRRCPGRLVLRDVWREISSHPTRGGHLLVTFQRDKRNHYRYLSAVVLEAFVGPRPKGMRACRVPGSDPDDNRLVNLRWDTPASAVAHLKWAPNSKARWPDRVVREVHRLRAQGLSIGEIGRRTGVPQSTVYVFVTGKVRKSLKSE
jgi:hypothetical protein